MWHGSGEEECAGEDVMGPAGCSSPALSPYTFPGHMEEWDGATDWAEARTTPPGDWEQGEPVAHTVPHLLPPAPIQLNRDM